MKGGMHASPPTLRDPNIILCRLWCEGSLHVQYYSLASSATQGPVLTCRMHAECTRLGLHRQPTPAKDCDDIMVAGRDGVWSEDRPTRYATVLFCTPAACSSGVRYRSSRGEPKSNNVHLLRIEPDAVETGVQYSAGGISFFHPTPMVTEPVALSPRPL